MQVYIIMFFKKRGNMMLILDILYDTKEFFEPFMTFLTNLWNSIKDFFLRYMSIDTFNILFFGIAIAIVLIVVLSIMNRD